MPTLLAAKGGEMTFGAIVVVDGFTLACVGALDFSWLVARIPLTARADSMKIAVRLQTLGLMLEIICLELDVIESMCKD